MSKTDKKYKPTPLSSLRGTGRRGRPLGKSYDVWKATTSKDEIKFELVRTIVSQRLEALQISPNSDEGKGIKEKVYNEVMNRKGTKDSFEDERFKYDKSYGSLRQSAIKLNRLESAQILMEALYSFTKKKIRENMDEGDWIENPEQLITSGEGWGQEVLGRRDYRKHVNVIIDNSGSTHTYQMRRCAYAMKNVGNSLLDILTIASETYQGITWMGFEFNKKAKLKEGYGQNIGIDNENSIYGTYVFYGWEPDKEEAYETNLAPLMKEIYEAESRCGLIGEPRLDIIITDGEFENQEDVDLAGQYQARRGFGVTTYVLNLLHNQQTEIELPTAFREIPLGLINLNEPDMFSLEEEDLRIALMNVVISEMTKEY